MLKFIGGIGDRIDAFLRRWLALPVPWFGLMPVLVAIGYWTGFRSLAFSKAGSLRIEALPKVFFDQTMYLEVLAKDLLHGFHILPALVRPLAWVARGLWPAVSLSELYVLGVIGSAVVCLWVSAALIQRLAHLERGLARTYALAAFLIVHAVLILRPGGPSWYVAFFYGALWLGWLGERAWEKRRSGLAILYWIASIGLSSVYPWYFATVVAILGLLFLWRHLRSYHVMPALGIGLVLSWVVILLRDAITHAVLSSYTVLLAYYGGVQFSHLTTLSNTILLMGAWFILWLSAAKRSAQHDPNAASVSVFFLAAWTGQLVLWFQSLLTGLSIVPDHFIYSIWLLSALSWAVWSPPVSPSPKRRMIQWVIGIAATLYVLSVCVRIGLGVYDWTLYPSLIIHVGAWTFLALTALPLPRARSLQLALLIGVISTALGLTAVWKAATAYDANDRELDGVRSWIQQSNPSTTLRWCSDTWGADFLFSTTGQDMYPVFSEKHDPVSITQLQNRMVEQSVFFSPSRAKELYVWDDMILHDLDFPCRAFQPAMQILNHIPMSTDQRHFVSGCNQEWADGERARVINRMEEQWESPVPQSSALCDRFVVRRRLWDAWRIPTSYPLLFKDDSAAVFGVR